MTLRPTGDIRPSSGCRRKPAPVDASQSVQNLLPRLWDEVCKAAPPWKARLLECWPAIVGPEYARHLRPGPSEGIRGRTLTVFADHPVIQFEAERGLRDLVARIRAAVPEAPIDRVLFRPDPGHFDDESGRPPGPSFGAPPRRGGGP